jgi:hypothetical protein
MVKQMQSEQFFFFFFLIKRIGNCEKNNLDLSIAGLYRIV